MHVTTKKTTHLFDLTATLGWFFIAWRKSMADSIITKQELIDAQKDAQTLEEVISGEPGKLVKTRLGRQVYTLASVPQINTMTREEISAAVAPKANKIDVDIALSNLSTTANKYYSTLSAANADIANIALNQSVTIGEEANSGLWYKATSGATSLTKSPYDPLVQAKMDATAKADMAKSEAIEISTKYSDLTKVDKAMAADPNVAIALTFKDGERTWLEAGYDGKPTDHSINLFTQKFSQNASGFKLSDRFVALSTQRPNQNNPSREYPVFQRAANPLVTYAQQSADTIYWTWMVNKEMWGGSGLALFYSTDHASTHNISGIYLLEADSLDGPWLDRGLVYRDDLSGYQTETPSVIYDPKTNKVLMFYQQGGVDGTVGAQQTCLATADPDDLTAWSRFGVVLDKEIASQDGDGHCGYFRPFFYCGELLGYSLYGGTNYSNAALWRSQDGGYTWHRDGSMIGWMQDKCKHLASTLNAPQNLCLLTIYEGDVINWRGQPWWVGVVGVAQSGSVGMRNSRFVTAPLSDDFTSLKTKVVDVTPAKASYEAVAGIDYPGNFFVWNGEIYSVYRTNGQKGAIALMKMINE